STGLAARIRPGQVIFEAYVTASNLELAQDGFKMAASKIGRPTRTRITPLKEDAMKTAED
ncbi:MAG: 50S ribosomal protein L16, partial [Nitrososphaera sp.]